MAGSGVVVLGIFVADLAFRAGRMPVVGETIAGSGFKMGPGGKGSNQAVAAARLGAPVTMISKIGRDAFGQLALDTWRREGIATAISESDTEPTGAAFIYVDERSGDNAIIVVPGAAGAMTAADVEASAALIAGAGVFVTQLEQPLAAARRGLEIAKAAGVLTVFNPAPAGRVDPDIYPLCDFVTPNETESAQLTGIAVSSIDDARLAGDALLGMGAGMAVITLGENGVLLHGAASSTHVPAFKVSPVVETAGAGDAFNGGFAVALSRGASPETAARFGCAVAGLSVTRAGTAPSMPTLAEVEALLARG
jgi:ribokinase